MATTSKYKYHVGHGTHFAHNPQYKRSQRPRESALRMHALRALFRMRTPAESFAHAKYRPIHAACSRYVHVHTAHPPLRMSRAEHKFAVRVHIRTHAKLCAHAPALPVAALCMQSQGGCTGRGGHGSDGTSTPQTKKCSHGYAWYGLCVQVLPRAGRTSTLCSVDKSGACGRLRHTSKAPVSADTLYGRKCKRFPACSKRPRLHQFGRF